MRHTVLLLGFALCAQAMQDQPPDVNGSKDHPIVSRMPNSHITSYKQQFDEFAFPLAGGKKEKVEGTVTTISYHYNSTDRQPSPLQVLRNYQNAVKAMPGGQMLFERRDDGGGETTLKVTRGAQEVWIHVAPSVFCAPTQCYKLTIAERGSMTQEVTAGQMLAALNKDGFIALYIQFDTGSHAITPQGQAIVDQIAQLLKDNAALNVALEGHTDNVGTPAANQTLSANRARSVVDAVAKLGIAPARMAAAGFGDTKPIADNRTEEGRAKNRRVELVKR